MARIKVLYSYSHGGTAVERRLLKRAYRREHREFGKADIAERTVQSRS